MLLIYGEKTVISDVAMRRRSLKPGVQIIFGDPKSPLFYDKFIIFVQIFMFYSLPSKIDHYITIY